MEKSEKDEKQKKFTIMKKIAKHGNQSVIIIPRILESELKPGTITQLTIEILEQNKNDSEEMKW